MPTSAATDTPTVRLKAFLHRDIKTLILPGLWLLFVTVNLYEVAANVTPALNAFFSPRETDLTFYAGASSATLAGLLASIPFALNLWGLCAGLFLGLVIVPNRRRWGNGKRFALGGIALAMMLGRITTGTVLILTTSGLPMQPWLALLLAPVVLFFGGMLSIGIVSGVLIGLFALFVSAPVAIFNQISRSSTR